MLSRIKRLCAAALVAGVIAATTPRGEPRGERRRWPVTGSRFDVARSRPARAVARGRHHGAAQESNLPSRGLHDRSGFEDRLGHRAHAAPRQG